VKGEALQVLTDPELVAARRGWEERLDDTSASPVYLKGMHRRAGSDTPEDAEGRMQEALETLAKHVDKLRDKEVFRPLSVDSGLYGVHFVDKIFGADVYELDGE